MPATLSTATPVWNLNLGDDENRFSPDWLSTVEGALQAVRASEEPVSLVVTATGKFFSNGLDLDWVMAHQDQWPTYVARVQGVFSDLLTLPVPTVCAINGHCFAAGAMLALACDYRVMRTERGFFCLPEVDIKIPFSPGMASLIQAKLTPRTALDAMATGRRYDAHAAVEAGIVDAACDVENLIDVADGLVRELAGKDRGTLGSIKSTMYSDVVTDLALPIA